MSRPATGRISGCLAARAPTAGRITSNSSTPANWWLQLRKWDVKDHHGHIGDPNDVRPGNGLLLWFEVDDIDATIALAGALRAEDTMPRHRNPPDGDGGPSD